MKLRDVDDWGTFVINGEPYVKTNRAGVGYTIVCLDTGEGEHQFREDVEVELLDEDY